MGTDMLPSKIQVLKLCGGDTQDQRHPSPTPARTLQPLVLTTATHNSCVGTFWGPQRAAWSQCHSNIALCLQLHGFSWVIFSVITAWVRYTLSVTHPTAIEDQGCLSISELLRPGLPDRTTFILKMSLL